MKEGVKRGLAVGITFLILFTLMLAGPAEAVILGLSVDDTNVAKGELINFQASAEVEAGEFLEVDYFILKLIGPELVDCRFDVNGTPISGCTGLYITKISAPPYGYGYGFGQGLFKFNITLDTSYFRSGKYETYLQMWVGGMPYQKRGQDIHIRPGAGFDDMEGCSIRAEGGDLFAHQDGFGEGKINFHIPLGNANNGKGSLTAQKGRQRFSYKFDVINVHENNEFYANITVKGECKVNGQKMQKTAYIYYNKTADTIGVSCSDLNIENMEITFKKRC